MHTEWTEAADAEFLAAVEHVVEQLNDGFEFEGALEHSSSLYNISTAALRHEYMLRAVKNAINGQMIVQ